MSLASKLLKIGKSVLLCNGHLEEGMESEKTSSPQAVEWLQKAFTVAEPLEEIEAPGAAEVKVSFELIKVINNN